MMGGHIPNGYSYLSMKEMTEMNGVTWDSIRDYMKRRNKYKYPWLRKQDRKRFVRIDVAEEYAARRLPNKPKGWPTIKACCMDGGLNTRHSGLTRTLLTGLRTKLYRNVLYVHPEDAEVFAERCRLLKPPPYHTALREAAEKLGCSVSPLAEWVARNNVPVTMALHKGHRQRFIPDRDIERYALHTGRYETWQKAA